MKRYGGLFDQIVNRVNLSLAVWKATKGKRFRPSVRAFLNKLDERLTVMQTQLANHTFAFGRYFRFEIRDPKLRTIAAPCLSERIAHHAIFNVCESVFEKLAIADTFACFRGRGQHQAVRRAQHFAKKFPWALKCDVKQYFASIRHDLLIEQLQRKLKDVDLLTTFERIIRAHETSPEQGLPIGALTSQHLANYFLAALDRFAKSGLKDSGYVRYMDDFILWSHDKDLLKRRRDEIAEFLSCKMGLTLS